MSENNQEDNETREETTKASAGLMQYSPENLVPFGPVHPALKEPEYFQLVLEGENIIGVTPRIGYVHRGIERAAQERTWVKNIYLFERICGICSFAHSMAYTQTAESLTEFAVPNRARYIRLIIAELERIHSHLLWLGLVGHWTGLETLFMWIWKDREHVLDLLESITGNRIHKSFIAIGGTRNDLPDHIAEKLMNEMNFVETRADFYTDLVSTEETLLARTKGIGKISAETAKKLCPVGPLLRCTGIGRDIRVEDPYAAYDEVIPEVKTSNQGDIASLLQIRLEEVKESARLVKLAIEKMPQGKTRLTTPRVIPKGEAVGHVEAPRGELFYYVRSGGGTGPERVKIRTPTMANILTATEMLKGHTLADVPVVLTGMDPCFGCMDRITVIDVNENKRWSVRGEELRKYGIEHYSNSI